MLMPAAALKQVSRGFSGHHSGVDLTAPYGSPVRAADAGTVVFAGTYFGYGNMIDLRHPNGKLLDSNPSPLLERNPLLFWKGLSFALAALLLLTLALQYGRFR